MSSDKVEDGGNDGDQQQDESCSSLPPQNSVRIETSQRLPSMMDDSSLPSSLPLSNNAQLQSVGASSSLDHLVDTTNDGTKNPTTDDNAVQKAPQPFQVVKSSQCETEHVVDTETTVNNKDSQQEASSNHATSKPNNIIQSTTTQETAKTTDLVENNGNNIGKENERHLRGMVPLVPGAVAVENLVPDSAGLAVTAAMVLSQPDPYQVDHDQEIFRDKQVERQDRDLAVLPAASTGHAPSTQQSVVQDEIQRCQGELNHLSLTTTLSQRQHGEQDEVERNGSLPSAVETQTTGLVTATPVDAQLIAQAIQVTIDEEQGGEEDSSFPNREPENAEIQVG